VVRTEYLFGKVSGQQFNCHKDKQRNRKQRQQPKSQTVQDHAGERMHVS
jgi:hypothetical protein